MKHTLGVKFSVRTSSIIFGPIFPDSHHFFWNVCECLCFVIPSFVHFFCVSFGCRNRVLQAKLSKDSVKRTCWTDCSERLSLVSRRPIIHHLSESCRPELKKDLSCLKGCSQWNFSCLWEAGETKTSSLGGINPKLRYRGKRSQKEDSSPFFFKTEDQS